MWFRAFPRQIIDMGVECIGKQIRREEMLILIKERRVREERLVSYQMLFDIILLSNRGESEEEVNEKGTQFRNKVNNLKPGGSRVGNFMPMSENGMDTYAFFVITCSLGRRTRIKTIMRENTKDEDLIIFK